MHPPPLHHSTGICNTPFRLLLKFMACSVLAHDHYCGCITRSSCTKVARFTWSKTLMVFPCSILRFSWTNVLSVLLSSSSLFRQPNKNEHACSVRQLASSTTLSPCCASGPKFGYKRTTHRAGNYNLCLLWWVSDFTTSVTTCVARFIDPKHPLVTLGASIEDEALQMINESWIFHIL